MVRSYFVFVALTRAEYTHIACYSIIDAIILATTSYTIALRIVDYLARTLSTCRARRICCGIIFIPNTKVPVVLSPSSIVVVATSHKPYMRLILFRLTTIKSYEILRLNNPPYGLGVEVFSLPILGKLESSNGVLVGNDEGNLQAVPDLMSGDSMCFGYSNGEANSLHDRIKCMDISKVATAIGPLLVVLLSQYYIVICNQKCTVNYLFPANI
ncbi:BFH_collapsed_G0021190.mRNA.1.CDS.1 [Saccharomyces cerevisiae]|nr:BFH_collapsed_G0021190.mRNA.1.CDS.1 [Saccharomyces cerevisiae]